MGGIYFWLGDKNQVGLLYLEVFFQVREVGKFSAGGGGLLPSLSVGKTLVNIIQGSVKLADAINYGLKKYFLEKSMGLVKNSNHSTACIDECLN